MASSTSAEQPQAPAAKPPPQSRRPPDPGRRLGLHLPRLPRAAAADAQIRRPAGRRGAGLLQHDLEADAGRADAEAPGDEPTHFAVIFDYSAKTFRNEIYADYKAHRPDPPSDLIPQFGLIRQATRAFNLACIEQEGWEADDLIATYALQASGAGASATIVSSDKDLMQLVRPGVTMVDTMSEPA